MEDILNTLLGLKGCTITGSKQLSEDGRDYNLIEQAAIVDTVPACSKCGHTMHKHGKRVITVIAPPFNALPCKFAVTYPRFRCPKCGEMWIPVIEDIDEKRMATKKALMDITDKCLRNTFEDVGNDYLLTGMTAKNIFRDFIEDNKDKLRFQTPAFLGIDEIKIRKLGEITVITDLEHHTLYDMLPKRNQQALMDYFKQIPNRENVLWVCSDMYRPFQKAIGKTLPNARWAIDHFHLVAYANLAVDDVRKTIQNSLPKKERISTKKGIAYTLKKRFTDLLPEEAEKIRLIRSRPKLAPMAVAFDLKEDFFNIYDNNIGSVDNAKAAFNNWEQSIPVDDIYDKFRDLASTVHNFYEQIFNYWDCPIAISNGFTECTNRMIRENNCRGRGYSFEILRGRTLYRKTNMARALAGGTIVGPGITEYAPIFHFEGEDVAEEDSWLEEGQDLVDPETGEVFPNGPAENAEDIAE